MAAWETWRPWTLVLPQADLDVAFGVSLPALRLAQHFHLLIQAPGRRHLWSLQLLLT